MIRCHLCRSDSCDHDNVERIRQYGVLRRADAEVLLKLKCPSDAVDYYNILRPTTQSGRRRYGYPKEGTFIHKTGWRGDRSIDELGYFAMVPTEEIEETHGLIIHQQLLEPDQESLVSEEEEILVQYERWTKAGRKPPPVDVVARDGHLLLDDGHHRLEIYRRLGKERIPAIIWLTVQDERGTHWLSLAEALKLLGCETR